jgi:N-formylglutamate amidohydrolase
VASAHSGRHYPQELLSASRLDRHTLRRSEDAWVDHLFASAPGCGAPLVTTDYARAFVDLNRARDELDPMLVDGVSHAGPRSMRVMAGLGVLPRSIGDGEAIYRHRLSQAEAQARLQTVYDPYHAALSRQLAAARTRHGESLLLDCHSMPAIAAGSTGMDVVLGDRFGAACMPVVSEAARACLVAAGLRVARNAPYAGGHVTGLHGRPHHGSQALQIEINRSLYMVEGALTLRPGFEALKTVMGELMTVLAQLRPRQATAIAAE